MAVVAAGGWRPGFPRGCKPAAFAPGSKNIVKGTKRRRRSAKFQTSWLGVSRHHGLTVLDTHAHGRHSASGLYMCEP